MCFLFWSVIFESSRLFDYFAFTSWFQPEFLFNPQKILEENYYKKYIVKPEEDVDNFGNKGGFYANPDFTLVLLFE